MLRLIECYNFENYLSNSLPVNIDATNRAQGIRKFKPYVPTLFIIARHPMIKMIPKSYIRTYKINISYIYVIPGKQLKITGKLF